MLSALFPAAKDAQRVGKYVEHEQKLDLSAKCVHVMALTQPSPATAQPSPVGLHVGLQLFTVWS